MAGGGLAGAAAPRPGTLDLGYGDHGLTFGPDDLTTSIAAVATQPDGKTVAVGRSGDPSCCDVLVFRFLADGSFDPSFGGGDGTVVVDFSPSIWDVGYDVAVAPDGKIVVVGGFGEVDVARLLPDGALDPTFGLGGRITSRLGAGGGVGASGHDVAVVADGSVIVAMQAFNIPNGFAVLKLAPNGLLDRSFGAGGVAFVAVGVNGGDRHQIFPAGLVVDDRGRIVVLGGDSDTWLVRLEPSGAWDRSFGINGLAIGAIRQASDLALGSEGSLVVSGALIDHSFAVERFTADGRPDTGFGFLSVATIAVPGSAGGPAGVVEQTDGRVVAAGADGSGGILLARFTRTGRPDPSFGTAGLTITPLGVHYAGAQGVALQPDGDIVVGGIQLATPSAAEQAFVARYHGR